MTMLTKESVSPTLNIRSVCGVCVTSSVQASHVFTSQRVNIGSTGSIICMAGSIICMAGSIICMDKTDVLRCQVVTDSVSLGGAFQIC